jgi:predicted Rossmann fold nucleotide-binding protein DprA/Smf involved in DNA uptake
MNPRLPKPRMINLQRSERHARLRRYLVEADIDWPVEIGDRLYLPFGIDVPDTLHVVTSINDFDKIVDSHSVGFGGICSPCVDGVMIAEILAQLSGLVDPNAFVVSGGVFGIDQAAHMGALDKNILTVAVLANPPDYGIHPYIPERLFLERSITTQGGALLSAYDTYTEDRGQRLKDRDGIIAWLSDVFVVVESSEGSDTVDTAIRAWLQGNLVVAINWDAVEMVWGKHLPRSRSGNDFLIKDGIAQHFPPDKMGIAHPGFEMAFRTLLEEWWFHRQTVPCFGTPKKPPMRFKSA